MSHTWKRLLQLARKTGDRLIVTDPDGEDALVIMDLDQYELLLDAGGDAETKENPWGALEELEEIEEVIGRSDVESDKNIWETMVPAGDAAPTWNLEAMTEQETVGVKDSFEAWQESQKKEPEEKVEEFGEERFYLEPIE